MYEYNNNLTEIGLFPVLGGLTPYRSVRPPSLGMAFEIYSNNKIESIFLKKIHESKLIKPIYNTVEEGVLKKNILNQIIIKFTMN